MTSGEKWVSHGPTDRERLMKGPAGSSATLGTSEIQCIASLKTTDHRNPLWETDTQTHAAPLE